MKRFEKLTNFEKFKTAEDREKAFQKFCHNRACEECDLFVENESSIKCAMRWLEREADQEAPLPCPCCGNVDMAKFDSVRNPETFIYCPSCGYHAPWEMNIDVAIARHNELCRKWGTAKPSENQA